MDPRIFYSGLSAHKWRMGIVKSEIEGVRIRIPDPGYPFPLFDEVADPSSHAVNLVEEIMRMSNKLKNEFENSHGGLMIIEHPGKDQIRKAKETNPQLFLYKKHRELQAELERVAQMDQVKSHYVRNFRAQEALSYSQVAIRNLKLALQNKKYVN